MVLWCLFISCHPRFPGLSHACQTVDHDNFTDSTVNKLDGESFCITTFFVCYICLKNNVVMLFNITVWDNLPTQHATVRKVLAYCVSVNE